MEGFLRGLLLGLGTIAVPVGLLWLGQGLGLVHWPSSSFMIGRAFWARTGGLLVVLGVVLLWLGLRMSGTRTPRRPGRKQR